MNMREYNDLYQVNKERDEIYFPKTNHVYRLSELWQAEVIPKKVLKPVGQEVLNSIANALTSSIANGNEKVLILVRLRFRNEKEEFSIDDKVYTKGNLDYYEKLRESRALRDRFRHHIKMMQQENKEKASDVH